MDTNEHAASIHYICYLLCLYTPLLCFSLCIHSAFIFFISLQASKREHNGSLLLSPLGWLICGFQFCTDLIRLKNRIALKCLAE